MANNSGDRTYNKGEWSELYAAGVIMKDGKVAVAADGNLRPAAQFVDILEIFMESTEGFASYDLSEGDVNIKVQEQSIKRLKLDPKDLVEFLDGIKNGDGASFNIPIADKMMDDLLLESFKSGSYAKADISTTSVIPQEMTPRQAGYSIKSQLGHPPTLLNASQATNFTYRIDGFKGNLADINAIDGRNKVMDRINAIKSCGGVFSFADIANQDFKMNMRQVDTAFPEIMATVLFYKYAIPGDSGIKRLCKLAAQDLAGRYTEYEITNKVLVFLMYISLGMVPTKAWDGERVDGFIIVKKSGDLVCFTLYEMKQYQEFLLENVRLDTPSTTRHNFGSIYRGNDGNFYFDLNLDVRMW